MKKDDDKFVNVLEQKQIPIAKKTLEEGISRLSNSKFLAKVVKDNPKPIIRNKPNPFHSLVLAIIGQQISRSAARAIAIRLANKAGQPFIAKNLAKVKKAEFKKFGFSETKANCVIACTKYANQVNFDYQYCKKKSDEEFANELTQIKGIGLWSAQMVLIFGLGRPNVMPIGDGGIIRGASILFKEKDLNKVKVKLEKLAKTWSPYNTIAATYLWSLVK